MDATQKILDGYAEIKDWHEAFYQDLHQHPELSFQETRTAGLIADRLRALGYEVHEGIGPTGLVGILRNGEGKTVLARADMDGLPVEELTDLPYRSKQTATDAAGHLVHVMHACGHDTHMTSLLATAELLASNKDLWSGTFIPLFQPAEEVGSGARSMIDGGLADIIPTPDVALGQHVMGMPYDVVASRPGPAMSAADSIRVTLHGRGTHGSMPPGGIDPITLGSAIVQRLNGIVSRELKPGTFGVVTVGSFQAGSKSNIIPSTAVLLLNIRAYDERVRTQLKKSIERIVTAECQASDTPKPPDFEYYDQFPLTDNTQEVYDRVSSAFAEYYGDKSKLMQPSTGSEDFSDIPVALGVPFLFWNFGGIDPDVYAAAAAADRIAQDIPANHSPYFAPVMGPTLENGVTAMTIAVMSYLGN